MLNDPASTRHLIEMNQRMIAEGKRPYYPGVTFLLVGAKEPPETQTKQGVGMNQWIEYFGNKGWTRYFGPFSTSVLTYNCGKTYHLSMSYGKEEHRVADQYYDTAEEAMAAAPKFAADKLQEWIGEIMEQNVQNVTPST